MRQTSIEFVLLVTGALVLGLGWNWLQPKGISVSENYSRAATKRQDREAHVAAGREPPKPATSMSAADPKPAPAAPAASGAASQTPPAPAVAVTPKTTDATAGLAPENDPAPRVWEESDGIQFINLAGVKEHLDDESAVLVDARKIEFYLEGHIPTALSIPSMQRTKISAEALEEMQAAVNVVVYCPGGDCEDSIELAQYLIDRDEFDTDTVFVYKGGFEEWQERELPFVTGSERGDWKGK